ncbi:MAG: M36 family metallopeptidase [Acidobacteria bacterium]|nr:M36 family metallopeptidase [Acidobacteriota bacterium]
MKKKALWISLAIVVTLVITSQLWNFSMQAAGSAGRVVKGRASVADPGIENFDIRNGDSKDAVSKFERLMQKVSSKQKEKNHLLKQAMKGAKERWGRGSSGMEVAFSRLTNTPEIIEMKRVGRRYLTPSSSQPRENIMRGFINQYADLYGMRPQQVSKLRKSAVDYTNPNGRLAWLMMEQRWNEMKVFGGEMMAAFTSGGEMVRVVSGLAGGVEEQDLETSPKVSAARAVVAGAASVGVTLTEGELSIKGSSPDGRTIIFHPAGSLTDDIKVELQYFPMDAGLATLAWSMVLYQETPAYYTLVDAEREEVGVLWRKNIVADQTQPATYVVYSSDSPAPLSPTTALPGSGIQGAAVPRTSFTLISEGPAFNNLGWLTDGANTTTGNNVDAGLDLVSPDGIDVGGRPTGSPARVFDFLYNPAPGIPPPGDAPTLPDYRFGEVVNMFFWTNRYHDRLYELGFTEAARNFQNDNFGRGGLGNDRVLAQAQDFSSTNNANFLTPPDGTSGRMQMFIFTGPSPDRSSGLDQEILIHELTHGTSNRLHNNAAGLNTTMSGGMGEGWSDFYALSLLSQPGDDPRGVYAVGGYSTLQIVAGFTDNYYYGIRRFPHATKSTVGPNGMPHNPLTFADIDPTQINLTDGAFPRGPIGSAAAFQVHNIGEVWCAGLWEVRARIIERLGHAAGNQRILQLVTDGMKLDPVNPTLLDGRNSILAATCAGFSGQDELDIWNGFAARGMGVSASAVSSSSSSVIQAFDTPNLNLGAVTITNDSCVPPDGFADPGETLTLNIPLSNPFCATPANGVSVSVDGGSSVSYGNIAAGATVTRPIPFTVPAAAACGSQLAVNVVITSSLGTVTKIFNLQIGRPVVVLTANYSSGNIAVPILDNTTVDIPINITDIGAVTDVNIKVRLNHTFDADLTLSLIGPDGTSVALSNNRGGGGDNFGTGANDCSGTPTVFDDSAATSIAAGLAPFAGSFRPETPLSAFSGKAVNGVWRLRVTDGFDLDQGTVGCFQLEISRQRFACCGVPGTAEIQPAPPVTVTNESCAPGNGAPDPDETVTVNFPLRNIGTGNTTNLVATLLPGGGVLAPSGPQTYGVLIPGGPTVSRPFTFTVAGICGGNLIATFALQDGAMNLGTVTFTIRIGGTVSATSSFSNPAAIIIPGAGTGAATGAPSNPYPATINVAGIMGTVSKVTVNLFNYSHTFPSDVDVLLVGPGGQKMLLMSDVGGGTDAVNVNLTFDDAAAAIGATVVSGTFSPTNIGTGDLFPAPAPAGPYPDPQRLSVFNGVNPNGTWSLFVVDDAGVDVGNINGGWRLNITTTDPACCNSPCVLSVPANIVVSNDPGHCGAVVNYPAPTFTGSCGVVTSTPPSGSFFPVGTTTVTVKGTRQDNTMTVSTFTVTVNAPTTTTVPSVEVQYSDVAMLKANVTNAVCPGGVVEFKVNGAVAGSAPVVNGMATLPVQILLARGSYPIMATYSSSSPGTGSTGSGTLGVAREDAIVTPASNPTAVKVTSPGGTAGPITLCASIREVSDGSLGNIGLATPVTFTVTPLAGGSPIIRTATTTLDGGPTGALNACTTLSNLPENVYDVVISVGGNFYTGSGSAALTVYDPALGFVAGGGTVVRSGVTSFFGIIAREVNGLPQGQFLYIERRPTGEMKLRSTSSQSLSIIENTALFIGRGTLNGVANHTFRATVVDNGEPGSSDQFGVNVITPGGVVIPGLTFNPITLSSGNVQVLLQPEIVFFGSQSALKKKAVRK